MIDLIKNCSITSRRVKGSVIRELLKQTNRPGMISFAGGLPSPESFASKDIARIAKKVLDERPAIALQYGATEGCDELRHEIVKLMKADGFHNVDIDNVLVTTSSQQALDLVGRIFIDPTDPILVELPTYLGGLQAFSSYGANFVGVRSDDNGMIIEELCKKLKLLQDSEEHYKFIYTVPDFQNPSGVTWSVERRKKLIDAANKYKLLIIDDSPYRELRFEGTRPPALGTIDDESNVITLRSFSKIFSPGIRLGWIVAHPTIIRKLAIAKQSVDLCAPTLSQLIASEFLKEGLLENHVKRICEIYKTKRDAMIDALNKYMPKDAGIHWVKPEGGLFLWLQLPKQINTDTMFEEAIKQNVAYVIGSAFHCDGSGHNTMRLNFSYPTLPEIDEGIKRIAAAVKNKL